MSSWFNISEDIWGVWRLCRLCRQRLAILGCWVFAFLAWFPNPGTQTSAPEGRRWLPTELVFQNIPSQTQLFLGKLQTLWAQWLHRRLWRRGSFKKEPGGLVVNTSMDWKACPEVSCIFFFLAGIERFPFFFELSQDWKSESLLCTYPRSLGRATVFHFACALCLAQGWPWETPKCLHHQRQQNVF